MDYKTVQNLGGTVTQIRVPYGRRLSLQVIDGQWEVVDSTGAFMDVDVAPDSDPEALYRAVYSWLKQIGKETGGRDMKTLMAKLPAPDYGIGDERATPPPRSVETAPPQPENAPPVAAMTTEVWQNPSLAVKRDNRDQKYLIVKGGKWQKFGAPAWPEVIPFGYFTDWPVGETYNLPDGLTEAVVQMNEKGQPKKVIEFR